MGAPKGNQFWKLRSKHGREKLFASPKLLWEAACEYFDNCEENPLIEAQAFSYKGEIENAELPRMRAFTLTGFLLYVGASTEWWREFKKAKHKDFFGVIDEIEKVIYDNKFTGAASGLLNANIIARDLGLADKKDLSGEIKNTDAIDLSQLSEEELNQYYALAKKSIKKD